MASNPYINKVVFGSATLVDLTGTTATADKILTGYGAFGADGAWMDGTATAGGPAGLVFIVDSVDANGGTIRDITTNEDAVITDTLDAHGGTIRSITGAEVYLQVKTVTPTSTVQVITPDQGYAALASVTVGAGEFLPDGDNMAYGSN